MVLGDRDVLRARAARIGSAPEYVDYDPGRIAAPQRRSRSGTTRWRRPSRPVTRTPRTRAACSRRSRAAATRARPAPSRRSSRRPVQKSVLMDAGIAFSGHTEFFAQRTHTQRVVMMLVGGAATAPLRVALVTTHLPLSARSGVDHARSGRADDRDRRFRARRKIRDRRAEARGLRAQPARRRRRASGPRGDRRDRAGDRGDASGGSRRQRPAPRRYGVRPRHRAALRCDRRDVPRPGVAGAQGGELRPRRQRDARAAVHPHVRRSRDRARPRGGRSQRSHRGPGQPLRRGRRGDRAGAAIAA